MGLQLVVTLMTNAIKATDRGSVELFVMVTESSELRVEVKDTGRGIPPKLQVARRPSSSALFAKRQH